MLEFLKILAILVVASCKPNSHVLIKNVYKVKGRPDFGNSVYSQNVDDFGPVKVKIWQI